MTEKERADTRKTMIYDLRLLITANSEKKEYTVEELVQWLDEIARAQDQAQTFDTNPYLKV